MVASVFLNPQKTSENQTSDMNLVNTPSKFEDYLLFVFQKAKMRRISSVL